MTARRTYTAAIDLVVGDNTTIDRFTGEVVQSPVFTAHGIAVIVRSATNTERTIEIDPATLVPVYQTAAENPTPTPVSVPVQAQEAIVNTSKIRTRTTSAENKALHKAFGRAYTQAEWNAAKAAFLAGASLRAAVKAAAVGSAPVKAKVGIEHAIPTNTTRWAIVTRTGKPVPQATFSSEVSARGALNARAALGHKGERLARMI